MSKLKQSETIIIKRSKINFAAYNPRKENAKVVEALRNNFKKIGFLGGIQFNPVTGNLIGGHKRLQALDLINKYDGSDKTDYDVKIESIELTEKQEKEQNIFLNSRRVQGETDFFKLAEMLPDISFENTGLADIDLDMIKSMVPDFKLDSDEEAQDSMISDAKNQGKSKEEIKSLKQKIKDSKRIEQMPTHFIVVFNSYDEKASFLESIGINGNDEIISGQLFLSKIQGE